MQQYFVRNFYNHNKRVLQKTLIKKIADCTLSSQKNRSSHQRCSIMKGILRNFAKFTGKPLHHSLFLNKVADLNCIMKETLAQVFSCEFCKYSKNTFFTEHLGTTVSKETLKSIENYSPIRSRKHLP